MSILTRATERSQSDWRAIPEQMWRFRLGKPEVRPDQKYGGYNAIFPLSLTLDEQTRLLEQYGEPDPGTAQSTRTNYRTALKLGWFKDNQYQTTRLVDFLCAVMGVEGGRKLRKWIEQGGGPPRPDDRDDQHAELALIEEWLGWWEDLEVFGTITHSTSSTTGSIWSNFGGPLPIGSLPGQPEPEYQSMCRGKLRAMLTEVQADGTSVPAESTKATAAAIQQEVARARTAQQPRAPREEEDDVPF